jgi:hypothetical protein
LPESFKSKLFSYKILWYSGSDSHLQESLVSYAFILALMLVAFSIGIHLGFILNPIPETQTPKLKPNS